MYSSYHKTEQGNQTKQTNKKENKATENNSNKNKTFILVSIKCLYKVFGNLASCLL